MTVNEEESDVVEPSESEELDYYRVQFRDEEHPVTASSEKTNLLAGTVVMVQTDHGLEPAKIFGKAPMCGCQEAERKAPNVISRVANSNEVEKYLKLPENEERAFQICLSLIKKHDLKMNLVRVERFFNGSKMIFYFTADNRVDFRALVKDLVQEFRTRVEMRQVGVRHETKMLGGVGTCGRELCCASFINKFDSVSIKMAKEQDLPLNPTKISGVCNRLLCCLTYEYAAYKKQRKSMPKPGKRVEIGDRQYLVRRQAVLKDAIIVETSEGEEVTLSRKEWKSYKPVKPERIEKKKEASSPKNQKKQKNSKNKQ